MCSCSLKRDGTIFIAILLTILSWLQRDADHRESLSTTLREVRAESLKATNDLARLSDRHADIQRRVVSAEQAETTVRVQLKSAEAAIRGLKEEIAHSKTMVAQTRASCANEVRKRDRQIESLKKHVADSGRTRGAGRSSNITTISIVGEFGGEGKGMASVNTAMGDAYDLRSETNEFLTDLAKGLSVENDTLLALVRRTLASLKVMGGLEKDDDSRQMPNTISYQSNCEDLSSEIDAILDHLRAILSNPSFVPIEEVEVRDAEIQRLRDNCEKILERWEEAVHLIDGWRRRMETSGKGVNIQELKMSLRLSPVRVRDVAETAQGFGIRPLAAVQEEEEEEEEEQEEEQVSPESPCPKGSLNSVSAPDYEDLPNDSGSDASSIFHDDIAVGDYERDEPNVEILEQSIALVDDRHFHVGTTPEYDQGLSESDTAANRGASKKSTRPRPGDFTTIIEENTLEMEQASMPPPKQPERRPQKKPQPPRTVRPPSPPPSNASTSSVEKSQASQVSQSHGRQQGALRQKRAVGRPTRTQTKPAPAPTSKPVPQTRSKPKPRQRAAGSPIVSELKSASSSQSQSQNVLCAETQSSTNATATNDDASVTATIRSVTPDADDQDAQGPAESPGSLNSYSNAPVIQTPNLNGSKDCSRSPVRRAEGSRLPLPANGPPQPSPQLTMASIAAKLAASEREADAARVRAKLRAARSLKTVGAKGNGSPVATKKVLEHTEIGSISTGFPRIHDTGNSISSQEGDGIAFRASNDDAVESEDGEKKAMLKVPKRVKRETRATKAASRRRSTLSPWEMQSLIRGDVASPSK